MHDLHYALRLITKNWTFSLTVVLILALCIGANTAVLSVVNTAMVKPLDYPDPGRLAHVVSTYAHGDGFETSVDGVTWELVRDRVPSLEIAMYGGAFGDGVNMGVNGRGVFVHQQRVSAGFFHVLGIAPEAGREFAPDEDRDGGAPAVILSHPLWKRYFGGDYSAIGRAILLRGEPYTIVGVMPAGFEFDSQADLWTPLRPSTHGEGGGSNYGMIARLRPGSSLQQAASQLALLTDEVRARGSYGKDSGVQIGIVSLQQGVTSDLREPLKILWIAVAAVFLLGCVNIGGMLLARASGRAGEIATRLALGASAARVIRQLLVESALLGLLGGVAGVGVGWAALHALRSLGSQTFPFLRFVDLDWRVLAATLALTLIAAFAFALIPALKVTRAGMRLTSTASRSIAGKRRFVSLGALVGGQVALAVPLLVGAGLLLRTFLYLWNLNPGFDPNHVLTARFSMQDTRYATSTKMNRFYDTVLARLRETPGIEAAAVSLSLPFERGLNDGVKLPGAAGSSITNMTYVTPEFFTALHVPLIAGRVFTASDSATAAGVVVVNQAFVGRYFKDRGAIGQPLGLGDRKSFQIVGVVGNVLESRAGWGEFGPIAAMPMVYIPASMTSDAFLQLVHTWFSPSWIVRSSLPDRQTIAAVEEATRSADPLLPMAEFRSISDLKLASLQQQRFMAVLVDTLGVLAILLTALGIYGLIANLVAERTRELGIRMALGSTTAQAIRTALRPGLIWVLAGAIGGSAASLALERFLKSYIYGIRATDPLTLAAVAAGLLLATLIASLIPASKILRLNPADTLRSE
jgi:predicted permease